jgi:hypothetical protein
MENLIKNLIDHLTEQRFKEYEKIEEYKKHDNNDLILITSGRLMEMDSIIQHLNEMLRFYSRLQPVK